MPRNISAVSCILAIFFVGCAKSPQNPEAVKQAVVEHLSKRTDGMLSAMDIDVKTVSFRADGADAIVSFRPKGSKEGGMDMNYDLELKDGKWAVKPKPAAGNSPHGGAAPTPGTNTMPPGHPAMPGSPVHPQN